MQSQTMSYTGYLTLLRLTGDIDSLREIRKQAFDDPRLSGGQKAIVLQDATKKIDELRRGNAA